MKMKEGTETFKQSDLAGTPSDIFNKLNDMLGLRWEHLSDHCPYDPNWDYQLSVNSFLDDVFGHTFIFNPAFSKNYVNKPLACFWYLCGYNVIMLIPTRSCENNFYDRLMIKLAYERNLKPV